MYQVIAGNIGTVYNGHSYSIAILTFNNYVADSKNGIGRMGGESVDLFYNEQLALEHIGPNDLTN